MAKEGLFDQLRNPSGLLGEVAGSVMAQTNKDVNRWVIAQLAVGPQDKVLEIGFGPGAALESVLKVVTHGFVAGIDHSATMEKQAHRRNRRAVHEGRLELQVADVASIPYEDETFDRVYAVNCFEYWQDPEANLEEVKRILKPGGHLFVATQPRWLDDDHAKAEQIGNEMLEKIKAAKFADPRLLKRKFDPITAVMITAYKH